MCDLSCTGSVVKPQGNKILVLRLNKQDKLAKDNFELQWTQ